MLSDISQVSKKLLLYLNIWIDAVGAMSMTRLVCILVLLLMTVLEIGPIPISGLLLILVVLTRPAWFYDLVRKIYD